MLLKTGVLIVRVLRIPPTIDKRDLGWDVNRLSIIYSDLSVVLKVVINRLEQPKAPIRRL